MDVREILHRIRHQVFVPEVTTMGSCPDCGASSRGAGRCAGCIATLELMPIVGASHALTYVNACWCQRQAELAVLDAAEVAGT